MKKKIAKETGEALVISSSSCILDTRDMMPE
jgi:hypothetical protein